MSNIKNRVNLSVVLTMFLFAFVVTASIQINVNKNGGLDFGPIKTFASGDGGGSGDSGGGSGDSGGGSGDSGGGSGDSGGGSGSGGGDGGGYTPPYVPPTCSNGTTNYPYCNTCPAGKILSGGYCITPPSCTPTSDTQVYSCPAGQTGNVTVRADYTCSAGVGKWGSYNIISNTCKMNNCTNGATNYPGCNICPVHHVYKNGSCTYENPVCSNGATNYPACNNNVCTNGATNYPYCNVCPSGQYYINGTCTNTPPTCSNGATNFPSCNTCPSGKIYSYGQCINQPVCTNGATNYPWCNNNTCTNGATNFPLCNNQCTYQAPQTQTISCGYGQTGSITQTRYHSCPSNTWSDWTTTTNNCQNNTCTNGATNYPLCNNNTCTNGTTNYPYCNQCPSGLTFINGTCTYHNPTCTNGATNYPWCNNNTCTNGATNYPLCNNNITYVWCNGQQFIAPYTCPQLPPPQVWCNGVQYYAGYICPQNNLAVQTTGANPLSTTATIYGYVNPYNTNATIWFDYGTSQYNLQYQTTRQNTTSSGQFTASLSNLTCGTRYYYRAAAQNNVETKYGSTLSFVTPNCYQAPVYYDNLTITRLATKVGSKSAQLNGSFVNNSGNIYSCVAFFDYGTSISNLSKRTAAQKLYANYKTNYFSQGVYGLYPNTTYFYRAGTTCNDGTKFGQIYKFTTGKIVKNYVAPAPVTIVADNDDCNCEIPEYMNITVDAMEGEATIGKTANYRVNFKNVSESAINNVVVRIVLPDELTVAGADKGQFTKGGKTVVLTIPMLRALEEGSIIISTNVLSGLEVGRQIVVNAYADYTTPTLKKSGTLNKGEVTAYTISVAGNGTAMNPSTGSGLNNTSYPDWMPQNLLEWLLFIVVLGIFFSALRYLFSAFK